MAKEEAGKPLSQEESVTEMLSSASARGFLLKLNTGEKIPIHERKISKVVVGNCWVYFTCGLAQFRTETCADKKELLQGNLGSVTCRRINQPAEQSAPEVTSHPSRVGFVPRSRHSRLAGVTI